MLLGAFMRTVGCCEVVKCRSMLGVVHSGRYTISVLIVMEVGRVQELCGRQKT